MRRPFLKKIEPRFKEEGLNKQQDFKWKGAGAT